jgi:hypothetical protein
MDKEKNNINPNSYYINQGDDEIIEKLNLFQVKQKLSELEKEHLHELLTGILNL